jgi:hypothetical protein
MVWLIMRKKAGLIMREAGCVDHEEVCQAYQVEVGCIDHGKVGQANQVDHDGIGQADHENYSPGRSLGLVMNVVLADHEEHSWLTRSTPG